MRVSLFSRGVSLGGTLLAVAVLSMLAFTLASLCVTHLRLSSHQDRSVLASNAARSAISAAIAKVLKENDFGEKALDDHEVQVNLGEAEGFLTFHPETAKVRNMPYSTNNLTGTEDALGADGALVPSGTVHLFALGKSGDTVRRVEAVLRVPPFPWAIASGGRIETKNGVVVGALPEGASLPAPLEDLLPADLVANGTQKNAVFLGSESTILGDIETPGQVELGPSPVNIRGEVRSGSSPVKLPALHPTDYDPQVTGNSHFDLGSGEGVDELTGSARGAGKLTFPQPLKLENAQLYVDGDLTLEAGVQGTGILVATGDITIRGGAQIEGATELAVVSGGRVQLRGTGANGSVIRGLFYAEQGLDAAEMTLVGSLLTGNASTGITLDQVNVYYEESQAVTTTSTTSFQDGAFNVGRIRPIDTGGTEHALLIKHWFKLESEPIPNEFEPLYKMDMQPTNGGYPLMVSFRSGFINLGLPPQKINDDDERDLLKEKILSLVPLKLKDSGIDMAHVRPELVPPAMDSIKRSFESGFGQSSGSKDTSQPTISLVGDISRFLPIEDRIRIVSWVER